MRLLFVVLALVVSCARTWAEVTTPPADAEVTVTTATLTYDGQFLREESSNGETSWVVRTSSGETRIPKSIITNVQLKNAPQQAKQQQPAVSPVADLELRLHGSNTIGARLAPELAKGFAATHGLTAALNKPGPLPEELDVEYGTAESNHRFMFHFQAHGSATAFQSLMASAADIGMSSRRINDKELAATEQAGLGNLQAAKVENVIALDGVVVIVNPQNPLQALTLEQIARIFSGEVTNWADVGGTPGPITIYSRDNKSGTFDTFKNLVLEGGHRKLAPQAKLFELSEDLSDGVAADPSGIGFIGFAYIRSARPLSIGTTCGLRFAPESFSVKTEEYPLARRLFFYVPEARKTASVNEFVSYALSADAQPIVASVGFIGLDIEKSTERYVLERGQYRRLIGETPSVSAQRLMQGFAERIADASRLSVTFRFKTASSDLDNRSLEDVGRLAAFIKNTPGAAQRVMLFGFADPHGNFQRNLELSRERALQVADALGSQGVQIPSAQVQGFGVIAPVACSDSEQSLEKNRRVEVWMRP